MVSLHPKMVGNSLLGAHVFIYSFHLLGHQYSKIMFKLLTRTHIKDFKIVMTLTVTVARGRNIPGCLALGTQKITKKGENNLFSNPCFSGGKFPPV
jgi:hypothetical protein